MTLEQFDKKILKLTDEQKLNHLDEITNRRLDIIVNSGEFNVRRGSNGGIGDNPVYID